MERFTLVGEVMTMTPCRAARWMLPPYLLVILFLGATTALGQGAASAPVTQAIVDGVSEIAAPGSPGPVAVVSERAWPVICGARGKALLPVVAAAEFKRGRVVAFGHTGYGGKTAKGDTDRMLANAVRWAAGTREGTIRVAATDGGWAAALQELGFEATHLKDGAWSLEGCQVLCLGQSRRTDAEVAAIQEFVAEGGGLVAAGLGWGWLQLNPGKDLTEHPLNRICAPMGIVWADGSLDHTSPGGYAVASVPSLSHARAALDAVIASDAKSRELSKADLGQATATLMSAIRALPETDEWLRPRLAKLLADRAAEIVPSEKKPILVSDALPRLLLALELEQTARLSAERVKAHPAAAEFPGGIGAGAETVRREIAVDTGVPDWHSTGLYAPAGATLRISIAEEARKAGLRIRIGAHKDELWDKDKWSRVPEITLERPLRESDESVASPFGGPVYVVVPRGCKLGKTNVKIDGAVEMPRYVHGVTTLDEWRSRIRRLAAPWAELESRKIILTIPASAVRELDDPAEVMTFWDELSDAHATLATIPLDRPRPERFVADVQISAGYMHSGYPIMTHLDVAGLFVDVKRLRAGQAWGFFHELGHNHQSGDWTFSGTGEVTCNLFALHAIDTICKPETGDRGHDAVNKPPSIAKYIAGGANFSQWQRDPFLALQTYIQLQREFGWEPFKAVFAEYRDLAKEQRPRSDLEKRDQWMVRFSKRVGRNLGPFFEAWGIPTSDAARQSIAELPVWMPEGFPPREAETR